MESDRLGLWGGEGDFDEDGVTGDDGMNTLGSWGLDPLA